MRLAPGGTPDFRVVGICGTYVCQVSDDCCNECGEQGVYRHRVMEWVCRDRSDGQFGGHEVEQERHRKRWN
jgi:hypothetical protein